MDLHEAKIDIRTGAGLHQDSREHGEPRESNMFSEECQDGGVGDRNVVEHLPVPCLPDHPDDPKAAVWPREGAHPDRTPAVDSAASRERDALTKDLEVKIGQTGQFE